MSSANLLFQIKKKKNPFQCLIQGVPPGISPSKVQVPPTPNYDANFELSQQSWRMFQYILRGKDPKNKYWGGGGGGGKNPKRKKMKNLGRTPESTTPDLPSPDSILDPTDPPPHHTQPVNPLPDPTDPPPHHTLPLNPLPDPTPPYFTPDQC